jgi:hypothetical protein
MDFKMNKIPFTVLVFCLMAFAQDLTVSKDSIQVYNNPVSSFADAVVFTSHVSTAIHLDSCFVMIAEMDTAGFSFAVSHNGVEVSWRTGTIPVQQVFIWSLDSAGQNKFRLKEKIFDPDSAEPLVFSGNNGTSQIFALEIGCFLFGETRPVYPKYIKGIMRLFFSNGQAVDLKLWSQDLRAAVRNRGLVAKKENLYSGDYRFLANGRRIAVIAKARLSKRLAVKTFMPEKGK